MNQQSPEFLMDLFDEREIRSALAVATLDDIEQTIGAVHVHHLRRERLARGSVGEARATWEALGKMILDLMHRLHDRRAELILLADAGAASAGAPIPREPVDRAW